MKFFVDTADTAEIKVLRYCVVHDCGPLINPLLARGQVHGGIAQGLGQALLEGARYDGEGSLLSHNWTTYAFPPPAAVLAEYCTPTSAASGRPSRRHACSRLREAPCRSARQWKLPAERNISRPPRSR